MACPSNSKPSLQLRSDATTALHKSHQESVEAFVIQSALSLLPWFTLAFALSPALFSLAHEAPTPPFAASLLVAPLLLARIWIRGDRTSDGPGDARQSDHLHR